MRHLPASHVQRVSTEYCPPVQCCGTSASVHTHVWACVHVCRAKQGHTRVNARACMREHSTRVGSCARATIVHATDSGLPRLPIDRCDATQHSGQILNPLPHRREELLTGDALAAKETAANGVVDGVFLRCAAVCEVCGLRDWAAIGPHDVGGLTIIGPAGRVQCDRVAYKCQTPECTAPVLSSNDPHQYLTANTIPATLSNVSTVMTAELGNLLLSIRKFTPGFSPTAAANALSMNGAQPPVNRKHVADVVSALADMEAVADLSCGKRGPPGNGRLVACDMNAKVPHDPPTHPMRMRPHSHTHHTHARAHTRAHTHARTHTHQFRCTRTYVRIYVLHTL